MKKTKLTTEHRQNISKAMLKRNDTIKEILNKGVAQASFAPQSSEGGISIAGMQSLSKSLSPEEAYQLSIDVRAAIGAIANNIAKVSIRFFSRSTGKEIVNGDVVDLFRRPSPCSSTISFLTEISSWFDLAGECAILKYFKGRQLHSMVPLNPFKLFVKDHWSVNCLEDVKGWEYRWTNGVSAQYHPSHIVFEKNFNPFSSIRGCSPLLAGINEVSSSYFATKYNKKFFENNAVPSHILKLPKSTPKKQRDDIESRYLSQFSTYGGSSHKVFVISGDEVSIEKLEADQKDMQFKEMISMNSERIASLYKVPAVEMGLSSKVRYESAGIEREIFLENTLLPKLERFTQMLQNQIVDPHFTISSDQKRVSVLPMTKICKRAMEKAFDQNNQSDIIVLLDPDSLPIMTKIRQDRTKFAVEFRNAFNVSPNVAAEYVGVELPEEGRAIRDQVWIPAGQIKIDEMGAMSPNTATTTDTTTAPNDTPLAGAGAAGGEENPVAGETDKKNTPKLTKIVEFDLEKAQKVKAFIREYRKLVVTSITKGSTFTLKQADFLNEKILKSDLNMKTQIRRDYLAIKGMDLAEAKAYFNRKNRQFVKGFSKKG